MNAAYVTWSDCLNGGVWIAVTCMISQNTGGATHTAHTCFWDAETDGEYAPHILSTFFAN